MFGILQTERIKKWKLWMVFLKWISYKSAPCQHMLLGDWIIYLNFDLQHINRLWFLFHISSFLAILSSDQLVPKDKLAVQTKQTIAITLCPLVKWLMKKFTTHFSFTPLGAIFKSPCARMRSGWTNLLQPVQCSKIECIQSSSVEVNAASCCFLMNSESLYTKRFCGC